MKKFLYLAVAVFLLGAGCAQNKPAAVPVAAAPIVIDGVTVTPLKVLEDSRCPKEVICVWAGTVKVKAVLEMVGKRAVADLTLGMPFDFGGKKVRLTDVQPEAQSKVVIATSAYKFTFTVTPAESPAVEHLPTPTSTPASGNSGVRGTTALGPTCPVERVPPDPNCAAKPYQATISVKTVDGKKEITQFTTARDGTFKIILAPGNYLLVPINKNVYPRGESQTVTVEKNKFTTVVISFDSGIR